MFCEKCGSNNKDGAVVCEVCKAPMPGKESCGGFADILSFEGKSDVLNQSPIRPTVSTEVPAAGFKNPKDEKKDSGFKRICVIAIAVLLFLNIATIVSFGSYKKSDKANFEAYQREVEAQFQKYEARIAECEDVISEFKVEEDSDKKMSTNQDDIDENGEESNKITEEESEEKDKTEDKEPSDGTESDENNIPNKKSRDTDKDKKAKV